MGVVFTSLFALGRDPDRAGFRTADVDLDPGCVLYGLIDLVPLDTVPVLGLRGAALAMFPLRAPARRRSCLSALFWKELKIVSFDPALATAMGIDAALVHYLLMGMAAAVATSPRSRRSVRSW